MHRAEGGAVLPFACPLASHLAGAIFDGGLSLIQFLLIVAVVVPPNCNN